MNIRVESVRLNSYIWQMSKDESYRCGISGRPKSRLDDSVTDLETGGLDPTVRPDCNLWNTNTICAVIFGPSVNVSRVLPRLSADPRFHHYVIGNAEGRCPSIATAQNSAEAYRDIWQSDRREILGANLGMAFVRT